ncbi:MAG: hypothetical protein AABY22_13560 [Nanoarchaeota archaeon]
MISFNQQVIGTCSFCYGPVTVPKNWASVIEPKGKCSKCGAMVLEYFGPVLLMEPKIKKTYVIKPECNTFGTILK